MFLAERDFFLSAHDYMPVSHSDYHHAGEIAFKEALKLLEPAKFSKKEYLVLSTKSHFPELFEKNDLALKWNLKTRAGVDVHLQRWVKWDQLHKRN